MRKLAFGLRKLGKKRAVVIRISAMRVSKFTAEQTQIRSWKLSFVLKGLHEEDTSLDSAATPTHL